MNLPLVKHSVTGRAAVLVDEHSKVLGALENRRRAYGKGGVIILYLTILLSLRMQAYQQASLRFRTSFFTIRGWLHLCIIKSEVLVW